MAIQDIGMFLPAESQYKTPGAFDEALRAEAMKRANWLASLDQYYEQLAEIQRQFNETLKFKVETRDIETSLEKEKMKTQGGQWSEEMGLKREIFESDTELKKEELAIQREKLLGETENLGYTSEDRVFDFLKDYLNEKNPEYSNPYGGHIYTVESGSSKSGTNTSSLYGSNYTKEEMNSMKWLD